MADDVLRVRFEIDDWNGEIRSGIKICAPGETLESVVKELTDRYESRLRRISSLLEVQVWPRPTRTGRDGDV